MLTAADSNNLTGVNKFQISKDYVADGDDDKIPHTTPNGNPGYYVKTIQDFPSKELIAPTTNSQSMDLHQIKVQLVSGLRQPEPRYREI